MACDTVEVAKRVHCDKGNAGTKWNGKKKKIITLVTMSVWFLLDIYLKDLLLSNAFKKLLKYVSDHKNPKQQDIKLNNTNRIKADDSLWWVWLKKAQMGGSDLTGAGCLACMFCLLQREREGQDVPSRKIPVWV